MLKFLSLNYCYFKACQFDYRWCEKAPQIQAWNCSPARNQEVPEKHWAPDQETPIPASSPWDCSGLQDWLALPECCHWRLTGGQWSLSSGIIWGHQLVRNSCQESHNYAKGHPACTTNQRGESLMWLTHSMMFLYFYKPVC